MNEGGKVVCENLVQLIAIWKEEYENGGLRKVSSYLFVKCSTNAILRLNGLENGFEELRSLLKWKIDFYIDIFKGIFLQLKIIKFSTNFSIKSFAIKVKSREKSINRVLTSICAINVCV